MYTPENGCQISILTRSSCDLLLCSISSFNITVWPKQHSYDWAIGDKKDLSKQANTIISLVAVRVLDSVELMIRTVMSY